MKNKLLIKLIIFITVFLCLPVQAQYRNTVTSDRPVFIPYPRGGTDSYASTTQSQSSTDAAVNNRTSKAKEESKDEIFNRKLSKQVKIVIFFVIALCVIMGVSGPLAIYTVPISLLIELIIYIVWYIHEMPYFY